MNLIGDIERAVAQLYPYRVPIAIALTATLALLVVIGRRRGWHRVIARHPRASAAVLALVVAIGAPLGWVLGSPLFIRTELVEDRPAGASGEVVLRGSIAGADEFHTGSGTASIVETADGGYVLRFDEFSVRNGPDLFVYLSPDPAGYTEEAIELGALKATDGAFDYAIPAGVDVAAMRSVVIWCRAFSVLFASAPLEAA